MTATAQQHARATFTRHYGAEPKGISFAPGRVNLIGDHVDYCDGLVLPMPLQYGTAIAWRRNATGMVRAMAEDFNQETLDFKLGDAANRDSGWRSYVRGMSATMAASGHAPHSGIDLVIAGNLPRGAGLSSSASLCIALGRALASSGIVADPGPVEVAKAAQQTEHAFAGVACGIMDQVASACGAAGHAMLLDCRDLSYRQVGLPPDWAVLVIQSGVTRELVDGEYNRRRQQCAAAAQELGLQSLRDAAPSDFGEPGTETVTLQRGRHVVEEIARVRSATDHLQHDRIEQFGQCLAASHVSLRDLFEVSHPQVDELVAILQDTIGPDGGARMTGGGFGGAVVAVTLKSKIDEVRAAIAARYSHEAAENLLVLTGADNAHPSNEETLRKDSFDEHVI